MLSSRFIAVVFAASLGAPGLASAQLIIGDKDGLGAQLYGFARLDVLYQDAQLSHPQFPEFALLRSDGKKVDNLSVHPRLTRLGVAAWTGNLDGGFTVDAKIELDFQNGGSESRELPRLRHGYGQLKWNGLTILAGQTWQLVSQLFPAANADSMMWNSGNTGDRAPQIRVGYALDVGEKGRLDYDIAMMMPNTVDKADRDQDGQVDGAAAAVGSYEARVGFSMPLWTEKAFKIAVGGHFGQEEYTPDYADAKTLTSWGVFAELDMPIIDMLGIRGEFFVGAGLSDVRGGVKQVTNKDGDAVETLGFWAELWLIPVTGLHLAGGFGMDDPEDGGDRSINSNMVAWGSVAYRPWKPFRVGAEYHHWFTEHDLGAATKTEEVNRVDIHLTYFF